MQILTGRDSSPHAEESARSESGPRVRTERVRRYAYDRPPSVTFDPRFDPRFTPSFLPSSPSSPALSLFIAGNSDNPRTSQSRLLELLTLNPLLHIAAVEFNLVARIPIVFARGIEYRALIAATSKLVSRQAVEPADVPGMSLVGANTRVVFDACVRVNKHRRAVNRACATRRIVIDKQPCAGFKKALAACTHFVGGNEISVSFRFLFSTARLPISIHLWISLLVFQFTSFLLSQRMKNCMFVTQPHSDVARLSNHGNDFIFAKSRFN